MSPFPCAVVLLYSTLGAPMLQTTDRLTDGIATANSEHNVVTFAKNSTH